MILLINEQEDTKSIVFKDTNGTPSRLVLPPKGEIRITATDYDQIRKNKAGAKALDGWKATGAIRILAVAGGAATAAAVVPAGGDCDNAPPPARA